MSDRPDDPKIPPAGGPPAPEGTADRARISPEMREPISPETASLLGLIDKLGSLLERTDLVELEVEAGETGIVLRKHAAMAPTAAGQTVVSVAAGTGSEAGAGSGAAEDLAPVSTTKFVKAPLTGIFYAASSPTSPPYVSPGQHITVGQVIGLIEAMKLFNEIKSDHAGRVVRVVAETGKLVKAKQPLIEVEP
jgi:acetyl-CoA carboxylase biotin carboxyl carrier protein